MYRNLLARVEVGVPIEDRPLRETVWEILQIMLTDRRQAWDMQPDGTYVQRTPPGVALSGSDAKPPAGEAKADLLAAASAKTDLSAAASAKAEVLAKAAVLGTHQALMDLARSRVAAAPAHENGG